MPKLARSALPRSKWPSARSICTSVSLGAEDPGVASSKPVPVPPVMVMVPVPSTAEALPNTAEMPVKVMLKTVAASASGAYSMAAATVAAKMIFFMWQVPGIPFAVYTAIRAR